MRLAWPSITQAAFDAIAATLPLGSVGYGAGGEASDERFHLAAFSSSGGRSDSGLHVIVPAHAKGPRLWLRRRPAENILRLGVAQECKWPQAASMFASEVIEAPESYVVAMPPIETRAAA